MRNTVTNADLAAQVANLVADMDALDRGVIEAGVLAARALARAEAAGDGIAAAVRAAGLDDDSPTTSFADPVSSRIQARRRRIEASGFRLITGGAQ